MDAYDSLTDPRALPLEQRRAAWQQQQDQQTRWLERLRQLTEGPAPEDDFPAFLLGTPAFADLAQRLGTATGRAELSTDVADELDWFVASFVDYLRTCDGEDAFGSSAQRHRG